jgi:hypothetical protein
MSLQEVTQFVQAALECSVYIAPREPGLTREEVFEIGKRAGFQDGEIGDALERAASQYSGGRYFLPHAYAVMWHLFNLHEEPDYRNIAAFDFVVSELNASVRADGIKKAQLGRDVIVERAVAQHIPQHDVEVAITILLISGQLTENAGFLRFPPGREYQSLPSRTQVRGQPIRREARARAYPLVKDVIERRTDGRPKYAEPLDAFAEELNKLGYGAFRLWWKQIVGELRRGDTQASPVSVSVLAAALVEGALTFVVKHAGALGLGVLGSKTFDGNPRTWRIDDLVSSAAAGQNSAILDTSMRQRAEHLIVVRQRIHAGRMLSEYPGGPPDLRPEEAREAKETVELVVRCVLDWLQKYPPRGVPRP